MQALDVLVFDDLASFKPFQVITPDSLIFVEGVGVNFSYFTIVDIVGFMEETHIQFIVSSDDQLQLTDNLYTRPVSVVDELVIFDFSYTSSSLYTQDTINFVETTSISYSYGNYDTLSFGESTILKLKLNLSVSDGLSFVEYPNKLKLAADPEPIEPTVLETITLGYGSTSIILKAPEFNDTETLLLKRINKTTLSGHSIITSYGEWEPNQLYKMEFLIDKEEDMFKLKKFVSDTCGVPIDVTDIYNNQYQAIIQNPNTDFSHIRRSFYAVTLDLYILP